MSRILGGGVRLLAILSGMALLWLMGLTVAAVIMRKVFAAPILGTQDLSEATLVAVVFLAIAYTGWTGGHIFVDLIGTIVKGRSLQLLDMVVRAVCAALLALVSWQTVKQGLDSKEYGDASNLIDIPHYPFFFVVATGTALYALVLLVQAVRAARGLPDIGPE